jgi:hypothetical protein
MDQKMVSARLDRALQRFWDNSEDTWDMLLKTWVESMILQNPITTWLEINLMDSKSIQKTLYLEYSIIQHSKWLWIKMSFENQPRNGVEAIKGMQDAALTSFVGGDRMVRLLKPPTASKDNYSWSVNQ